MVRKKEEVEAETFWQVLGFKRESLFPFLGIVLFLISCYMLVSFFSFLSTSSADYSLVMEPRDGDMLNVEHEFLNKGGSLGAHLSNFFIRRCFGLPAFFIPLFLIIASVKLIGAYEVKVWKWFLGTVIAICWLSITLAKFVTPFFPYLGYNLGGDHGAFVCRHAENIIGNVGLSIALILLLLVFMIYVSKRTISLLRMLLNPSILIAKKRKSKLEEVQNKMSEESKVAEIEANESAIQTEKKDDLPIEEHQSEEDNAVDSNENVVLQNGEVPLDINVIKGEEKAGGKTLVNVSNKNLEPYDPKRDLENYKYPTLDLLDKYEGEGKPHVDMDEQKANKDRIVEVLRNFGVEISSIKATVGPTITLYEITPAQGVRIAKIRNLEDDIALSLSALGIRIIAPIPGKGTIGIEVPNAKPSIVSMESILNSRKFQETEMDLPCAVGKTITNEVFMFDLAKMPHLLVAGATGQGKSVGLNAIITSLLYKKHPSELKIVLIDPKKVEFSIYEPIAKHFLAVVPGEESEPIITDVTKVVRTLNSLCQEMDMRYDLLKLAGARNIKEYNREFVSRKLNPLVGHKYMPYIVVVIDEFGDLIMTAGKEIELPIARIAQLARAVGIHMIIATQRPTTTIITGNIKANFPGRMAFKVSAMVDSKTILDRPGANQLVGRGDMLLINAGEAVRVQCAFVDTPDVVRLSNFISQQQGYPTPFELPEPIVEEGNGRSDDEDMDIQHLDPLFEEAARLVVLSQSGSTSLIQRKFSIGYNRAGRLMDQLEHAGIVGVASGSKPREVFIQDEVSLERLISKLS